MKMEMINVIILRARKNIHPKTITTTSTKTFINQGPSYGSGTQGAPTN
jgi:hypothetical protein